MELLLGPLTEIFQRYEKHELDRIHMVYSRFVNTMRQEPRMEVLLPIGENVIDDGTGHSSFTWEYLYEPESYRRIGIFGSPLFRVCGLSGIERQHGI